MLMNVPHGDRQSRGPASTKIIATVGPACDSGEQLRNLAGAGVDVFRLNFAHGEHETLGRIVEEIRDISEELGYPLGILGDLAGPKVRLGELPGDGLRVEAGRRIAIARHDGEPEALVTTYEGLVDDLDRGDILVLADGRVSLRVDQKEAERVVCVVERPGLLRSRQGVNLPRVRLRLPSLTEKDLDDLAWALEQRLDFVGLSFVRRAEDVRELRRRIEENEPERAPFVVAKIEKPEALEELDEILAEADAVMVARGDLGVEVGVVYVPVIQKRIIRSCNRRHVPVITATQMLESMQESDLPTRAEASDVANAVLDGSDAVMLSGETAIGKHPVETARMMDRIVREVEPIVEPRKDVALHAPSRTLATQATRAVTLGAIHTAERLDADLIVALTRSGRTAMALSELRSRVPIVALTDSRRTARRLSLVWGVSPVVTDVCDQPPERLFAFVRGWGERSGRVEPGDRIVFIGTTDWSREGKDLVLVHVVPGTPRES